MPGHAIRTLLRRLEVKSSMFATRHLFLVCSWGRSFTIRLALCLGFSFSICLKVLWQLHPIRVRIKIQQQLSPFMNMVGFVGADRAVGLAAGDERDGSQINNRRARFVRLFDDRD